MPGKGLCIGRLASKRVGGIEPPSLAWKAKVLPLNYTRKAITRLTYLLKKPSFL